MKLKATLRSFLAIAGSSMLTITYVSATPYYWDSDNATPGFGATAGTWSSSVSSAGGNGFTPDPLGATDITLNPNVATATTDSVFFGTSAAPYTGVTTISGTVDVGSIYLCSTHSTGMLATSSPVINFAATGIFESAQGATFALPAVAITGAATSLTIRSGRTVQLANITNNIPASSKIILETSPDSPNLPLIGRTQITNDTLAFATGSITYGTPVDGDTVTVNGVLLTKAAVAGLAEFTSIAELNALVTAITGVDSTENGLVVSITAATAGKEGNAITLAETGAMTVSGSTLAGGLTPQLGVGTDLEFNGGSLRFATALPFASLSALNAAHPVTFVLNKSAGFDNQVNSTTFTVNQSVNLGSGIFQSEGSSSGLIKLTQPNTWAELRLVAGTCEIDNLNQLGTAVRWGSSGVAGGNGTLKILGPITGFGAVTMLTTADKGVGLNIDDPGNTFTVNQTLAMGIGGFTKSGAGTLNLDMTATSSTYTGNTAVSAGTMNLSNMPGTATTASVSAGTLAISGTNTHTGLLTCSGTGTLTISGNNSGAIGGVTLTAGTLNLDSTLALGSGPFTVTAGTINNTVATAGNNTVNFNGSFAWQGATDLTFGSGAITNNGNRTITLNGGPGRTLAFGGAMTNLIAGAQATTVNGAGNTLSLGGYALSNTATLRTCTVQGTGNVTINGAVSGSSFGGSEAIASILIKSGTGTLTLKGNNIYTGTTTVQTGGCLALVGGSQNSAITVNNGGFLGFTLGQPTTSTKGVILAAGHKVRITGTPTPGVNYTLLTTSTTIFNAPDIETPLATHALVVEGGGTTLVLKSLSTPFQDWALLKGLTGANNAKTDDPDGDGKNNNFEFAFNGNPLSGSDNGMIAGLVQDASLPAGNELTLVVAVRNGATFGNAGSPVVQTATADGVTYTIQGTLDLVTIPGSDVSHVGGPSNTAPSGSGLTADLTSAGWKYHTFKLVASEGLGSKGFLRAKAE